MKNIAIYVCGEVSKKCTANGCLRTFNQKEDSFKRYEEVGCKLVSFNNCNGCDGNLEESLKVKIEKLKKANVEVIHISTCIRGRCEHYEQFAKEFAKYFDVIGYTHGSAEGKENNNININRNFMRDGHIHSPYCPHGSDDTFEDYINKAINIRLKEITFTEHLPLPKNFIDPSPQQDSSMEEGLILDYFKQLYALKDKYKNKIKINVGVEVDYIEGYENEIKEMLNKYGKYIEDSILSVHMLKIKDKYCCMDYSPSEFEKIINSLGSIKDVYNKYYETLKLAINSDLGEYKPKRIGHLNLVRKYNKVFPYDYKGNERLEEVVMLINKNKYEVDFNVSGIRNKDCKEPYIHDHLLDLIKKYNVPIILGSDSHCSRDIGSTQEYTSII